MDNLSWQIGNVKITQIIELDECEGLQEAIPNATSENLSKIPWLTPNFINNKGKFKSQISSFIVESMNSFIMIDTGVGNNKKRTNYPFWSNLKTNFLERLKQSFPNIDFLMSTHLHLDHVGWNTILVDGNWVPTFPNTRYLIVDEEFNYWKEFPSKELKADVEGIKDSVMPVYDAGLVDLVPSDYTITSEVLLIPTPGHTPGHVSILIKSKGKQAVITGDSLHHPCQVAHPQWETIDTNKEQANKSRKALLEQFADTDTLFIGSHFAPPTAGYLHRDGTGFKLDTR